MMILSIRTKEAIKTALAMTIAYGTALGMGWDRPMWAAFAVAFISLATIGQSLNKGAMRMFGTLVAAVMSLTILALSIQDRWLFMVLLSSYVGFCTYMMSGTKNQYFWNVCGFVCVIICMDAGPNSTNAFNLAILRAQETGMGILVYTLVSTLLWPTRATTGFDDAKQKLVSAQHQFFRASLDLSSAKGDVDTTNTLRLQGIQAQTQFNQMLQAAEADSYEIWESRSLWSRYQRLSAQLAEALGSWCEGVSELQSLDVQQLYPHLSNFVDEIEQRFVQIERMFAGQSAERHPVFVALKVDHEKDSNLSHFHRAALVVSFKRLQSIESLTYELFEVVNDIVDSNRTTLQDETPTSRSGFSLDPDRLTAVVRVMVAMWLVYIMVIYVNGFPGGSGAVTMVASLGMALGTMPQLPTRKMYRPAAVAICFASLVYFLVMPQLSSFIGLGTLIFVVTFIICYLFAAPTQLLGRALALTMFVIITGISNEQSYSFISAATTALMFAVVLLFLTITAYIPFDPRPERAFQRLIRRYFSSCEYLASAVLWRPSSRMSVIKRLRRDYHVAEISKLPQKLALWGRFIDCKALPGTSPEQVQTLVSSLQALTYRLEELLAAGNLPQSPYVIQEMLADIRFWQLGMQKTFHGLAVEPAAGDPEKIRASVYTIMDNLESRIKEVFTEGSEKQVGSDEGANFYMALGAYRGLSEALVAYTGSASNIDWQQWRQERF